MRQVDAKSAGAILIACQAWHQEHFGGAFKLAAELAGFLAEQGHGVHFLCGTDEAITANPVEHAGVKLWRYPNPRRPSPSPFNLLGHLYGSWRVAGKIAEATRIDCINGHSPLQFLGATSALTENRIRKVYSVHSPFADELRVQWSVASTCLRGTDRGSARSLPYGDPRRDSLTGLNPMKRLALRIVQLLEQHVYRLADAVQCDSAYSLSVIKAQYPRAVGTKGVVCPGWVDLDRFKPVPDRNEARRSLGKPWVEGVPTFLSVRRLEGRMGLDALIEACTELRHEGLDFQVLIGGTGPMYQELQQKICNLGLSSTVHLLGRIPDQTLPLCYAAADCFVLPTRSLECFGLIVLEALACNTPVIATPVGSIPEVMGPYGAQGWLSEDPSPRAIADRMRAFLDARLVAGNENFRRHAEQYSSSAVKPLMEGLVVTDAVTHMMSADHPCLEVAAACHNGPALE